MTTVQHNAFIWFCIETRKRKDSGSDRYNGDYEHKWSLMSDEKKRPFILKAKKELKAERSERTSKTFKRKLIDDILTSNNFVPEETTIDDWTIPYINHIHQFDNSIVVYEGRECTIDKYELYEYKQFYIIVHVKGEGAELGEVDNIEHNYINVEVLLHECIKVIDKTDFREEKYLAPCKKFRDIISYFKTMHPDDSTKFLTYVQTVYNR